LDTKLIQVLEIIMNIKSTPEQTKQDKIIYKIKKILTTAISSIMKKKPKIATMISTMKQKNSIIAMVDIMKKKHTITAIFGIMVLITVAAIISNPGENITQETNGGNAIIHEGTGNIIIGLTLDQHEQRLRSRETEVRAELVQAHTENRKVLEVELSTIEQQLQNKQASYRTHIANLKLQIVQLEQQRGEFPDALLDQAIAALQQGKSEKAAQLFKQIEEEGEGDIKRVAEAAFQGGKIAEDAIRYTDALARYEKAVRLQPDNTLYLNQIGNLHHQLANYQEALEYLERALANDLKTFGEAHPKVAETRNNLGKVWGSLGKYHKAIDYFEQALASYLKTYGKDHPEIAETRNNLGLVWRSLGKYRKAIEYFELALASFLNTPPQNLWRKPP